MRFVNYWHSRGSNWHRSNARSFIGNDFFPVCAMLQLIIHHILFAHWRLSRWHCLTNRKRSISPGLLCSCRNARTSTVSTCVVASIYRIKTSYFESWRSVNQFNSRSNGIFVDVIQGMFGRGQMLTTFSTIICGLWKRFLTVWATYNSHSKSPYRVATLSPRQSVRERLVVCQCSFKQKARAIFET